MKLLSIIRIIYSRSNERRIFEIIPLTHGRREGLACVGRHTHRRTFEHAWLAHTHRVENRWPLGSWFHVRPHCPPNHVWAHHHIGVGRLHWPTVAHEHSRFPVGGWVRVPLQKVQARRVSYARHRIAGGPSWQVLNCVGCAGFHLKSKKELTTPLMGMIPTWIDYFGFKISLIFPVIIETHTIFIRISIFYTYLQISCVN